MYHTHTNGCHDSLKKFKNGAIYDLHDHNVVWFHKSHKLDHVMAIVSGKVRNFSEILLKFFNERKFCRV